MNPRVRATRSASFKLPHRGWLFDLDGTVYRGEALIPGAAETIAALRAAGRRVAFLANKPPDTRAGYAEKLTRLVATNPDGTSPTEEGEIPDCAGMIAPVEAVTAARVEVIVGKPSPIILEVALERLGLPARECAMVGDRVETDMVMGKRLGLATVLVLSGVTRADDPRIAEIAPDAVLGSVRELVQTT